MKRLRPAQGGRFAPAVVPHVSEQLAAKARERQHGDPLSVYNGRGVDFSLPHKGRPKVGDLVQVRDFEFLEDNRWALVQVNEVQEFGFRAEIAWPLDKPEHRSSGGFSFSEEDPHLSNAGTRLRGWRWPPRGIRARMRPMKFPLFEDFGKMKAGFDISMSDAVLVQPMAAPQDGVVFVADASRPPAKPWSVSGRITGGERESLVSENTGGFFVEYDKRASVPYWRVSVAVPRGIQRCKAWATIGEIHGEPQILLVGNDAKGWRGVHFVVPGSVIDFRFVVRQF